MGRYTTVQAYGDNNPNMRSVSYEQATASGGSSNAGVRPEKVDNPYGSTAGAGSGEFHVYRHARSREMTRLKQLDEAEAERKADLEFVQKVEADRSLEEAKTEKRRRKRQRQKEAKLRKRVMKKNGLALDEKKEPNAGNDADEFEYTPRYTNNSLQSEQVSLTSSLEMHEQPSQFENNGSFLEMMQKKLMSEKSCKGDMEGTVSN